MNKPETVDPRTGEVTETGNGFLATAGTVSPEFTANMPIALQVYFNDGLYARCKQIASIMANAHGYTPAHLIGKTEACFAITALALRTKMDPFFLAQGSYQTPGGQVGYTTKVVQAVVETAGVFSRSPEVDYTGPWEEKIDGKFKFEGSGDDKKKRPVKTWTREDARGCGIKITFHFKDQDEPEVFEMELAQVGTMFSTQWDAETRTQFYNLAFRRGMSVKRPSVMAGVQHADDLREHEEPREIKDITPKSNAAPDNGLDDFANEETATNTKETVVETVVEDVEPEPTQETTPENTKAKAETAPQGPFMIWKSPDDERVEHANFEDAIKLIVHLVKSVRTGALAKTVTDQNMEVIAQAKPETANYIEKLVQERLDKEAAKASGGSANSDAPKRQQSLV